MAHILAIHLGESPDWIDVVLLVGHPGICDIPELGRPSILSIAAAQKRVFWPLDRILQCQGALLPFLGKVFHKGCWLLILMAHLLFNFDILPPRVVRLFYFGKSLLMLSKVWLILLLGHDQGGLLSRLKMVKLPTLEVVGVDKAGHGELVDGVDGQLLWAARQRVDT